MDKAFASCSKCGALNSFENKKYQEACCGKCQSPLDLHGRVAPVSASQFQKIIAKSDKVVVVDFWASWCGPCRQYGPEFEAASLVNPDVLFLKIDTEKEQLLSSQLGIRGIPCTIAFKNGQELKRQSGVMPASYLTSWIKD
jgi:thioredoxin 2